MNRGLPSLLDVRLKLIFTFKIFKSTSLEYFELPNRMFLVAVASASFKILVSVLIIFLRKVLLPATKLGQ